jgi:hypothetical protein
VKLTKAIMVLFAGQMLLNPLAAFAEMGTTVTIDKTIYSCYAVEKNGSDYYDASFDDLCQKAGYERQAKYEPSYIGVLTKQRLLEDEADTYNSIRSLCVNIKANQEAASLVPGMNDMCARVGVLINKK